MTPCMDYIRRECINLLIQLDTPVISVSDLRATLLDECQDLFTTRLIIRELETHGYLSNDGDMYTVTL